MKKQLFEKDALLRKLQQALPASSFAALPTAPATGEQVSREGVAKPVVDRHGGWR